MTPSLNTSHKRFSAFQRLRAESSEAVPITEAASRTSHVRRYWSWLRPELRPLLGVLMLSLVGIAIDMVWPLVSAHLIDRVILRPGLSVAHKTAELSGFALGMIGLLLCGAGLGWLRTLRLQLLTSRLAFQLRAALFHRVLRLPMSDLNEMKTGGILSRLSNDVDGTTGLLQQALL